MGGPEPGRPVSRVGPYRIERRLGTGGMGVVYLGHDDSGAPAAVKLIRPEYVADPQFRARLRRELDAARRVPRSCTAPVLGADLEAEPPWVATEFIDGPALDVVLLEQGRLRGEELERFAVGVAVALRAIHEHGVVHRDLKPSNVLLSPYGPRVIDFGIARVEEGPGAPPTQLTQTGMVVGTPAYMAPEQLRGEPVKAAVDVFAWAALVTYAATGRPPFGAGDTVMQSILSEPPDLGELAEPLRQLVLAAFDKDPAGRPSASELVDRLSHSASAAATQVLATAVTGGAPAAAGRAAEPGAPPQAARRRWAIAAIAAIAATAAAVAVTAAVFAIRSTDDPPADAGSGNAGAASAAPESPQPTGQASRDSSAPLAGESITIGANRDWEPGVAAAFLWKAALADHGADVDVRFDELAAMYEGAASGDVDLIFDYMPVVREQFWDEHGPGMEDLGAWSAFRMTIAVNEDAPIQSLEELAGAADEFDNRLVGIEPDTRLTRVTEEVVIPAYGLAENMLVTSSMAGMLSELGTAIDQGRNVAVTLWEPHWAYDAFPIRNLADPENTLGDPEEIRTAVHDGFSEDFPQVAGWLRNFEMTRDQLHSLANIMFNENEATTHSDYDESVERWLDENPDYLGQLTGA